jgi:glycerol-3-phosphate O-acyltransferase
MDNRVELDHSVFAGIIERMIASSTGAPVVTEKNVYQEGNPTNKPLLGKIVRDLMLPGSRIEGFENLLELFHLAQKKRPCLILMEHYSNFDIPCLYELLEHHGEEGEKIAKAIVSVAGVKLNEESKLVLAFTEIFTRVVLYPSRSMDGISDPKERREAERRRAKLNIAAMKALMKLRKDGRLILVFPTGTRYRSWDPSTGKGLKEIDSYLKFYSHMIPIAVNGNTLLPNPSGNMDEDFTRRDIMIYTAGPVLKCSEFRRDALKSLQGDADPKQHVVDRVMAVLSEIHEQSEKTRLALLESAGQG